MIQALANAFRIPDLRRKILFTLAMIGVYRLGAHIPVPGVTSKMLETLASNVNSSGALGLLNLFAGGALEKFAIFSLGIMPYITSSIIMQLLTVVIPKLDQWQKQGDQLVAPTTSLPLIPIIALFWEKAGIARDHALRMLKEAITEAMKDGADKGERIEARIKDVDEAVKAVKEELIAKLPKVKRAGRVVTRELMIEVLPVHEETLAPVAA